MLGASGGIKLWIELYNAPEFYTNGDQLYGTLLVESGKPVTLHDIELKLRCEEQAHVWVNNSQGGYYEVETVRHLSQRVKVFPDRIIEAQASDQTTYTLQSGTHHFDFKFQIPIANRYPSSLQVRNSNSGIRWYIKGVVHRGNVLTASTASRRTTHPIKVISSPIVPYYISSMVSVEASTTMSVFLPSYAEVSKTTAGKLRGLLPSSHLKKRANVHLIVTIPLEGILQNPVPICLQMDVTSEEEELLLLKSMSLCLKQKIVVSVGDGWRSSVHRETYHIWTSPEINVSLKKGLHAVQEELKHVCVEGRLYETFMNQHFQVSYKLVAEAVVACREKPSSTERLRVSVPFQLHNFLLGQRSMAFPNVRLDNDHFEELPTYQAVPRIGEETLNALQ